jgi:hypothetical protein
MNLSAENSNPQRAVVLVVDKYSQDVHLASLTAGVKYPVKFSNQAGIAYTRGFYSITPIAVGRRVKRGTQPFVKFQFQIPYTPSLTVVVDSPRVFTYSVDSANNTLQLSRVI